MEKHAIKKLTRDFVEAYDRRDAAAAAELYAEDAKLLPPNMEIVIGKQAIQAFWNGAMQMGAQIDLKAVEVVADEALAYERGIITITFKPDAARQTMNKGKYITVMKRQKDGSWRVVADIWNSDPSIPAKG